LAFATRPYRKFTDDRRALDAVLRRLVTGADAIKGDTRSYTSPWDMTLAQDLEAAWTAPATSMRDKQRLIRTLIEDIVADIDDDTGEIVLVVHWKGGRHTELWVKKPKSGEHNARTSEEALGLIREMAGRWPDESIAACLNRMGMPTGQGKTWNAKRVSSIRRVNDIHGYLSADKDGPCRAKHHDQLSMFPTTYEGGA